MFLNIVAGGMFLVSVLFVYRPIWEKVASLAQTLPFSGIVSWGALLALFIGGLTSGIYLSVLRRYLAKTRSNAVNSMPGRGYLTKGGSILLLLLVALPAVLTGEWTYGQALMVSIIGFIALQLVLRTLDLFEQGEGVEWQSHWGGLGGGLGGWRLSSPIVLLLMSAVFVGLMVASGNRKEAAAPKEPAAAATSAERKAGGQSKEEKVSPKDNSPKATLPTGSVGATADGRG